MLEVLPHRTTVLQRCSEMADGIRGQIMIEVLGAMQKWFLCRYYRLVD